MIVKCEYKTIYYYIVRYSTVVTVYTVQYNCPVCDVCLDSTVGRAPDRSSGGRGFKSRSSHSEHTFQLCEIDVPCLENFAITIQ